MGGANFNDVVMEPKKRMSFSKEFLVSNSTEKSKTRRSGNDLVRITVLMTAISAEYWVHKSNFKELVKERWLEVEYEGLRAFTEDCKITGN